MSVLSRYQSAGRMVRLAHRTLVALGVIVIMAGPASAADSVRGGTLNVGMPETFKGFSPYIQIGRQGFNVAINVFDTLTRYGADYLPEPMLATDWEQPDDTTWRFSLRKGVTFHDGTPFNAEAAKYSLEKIKESRFGKNLKRVTEVLVVDEYTIDIKLSEPFPVLPAVLTQQYASIVSPTAFEKMGADEFAKHPVGSGAFKFETQDSTGSVTLLRNDDYWDKDEEGNAYPYLDKVVYRIVPDRQTAALSMQAGDIDFN